MPTETINGIDLKYRESGEGFPIVLVHGFTGNLRNWALTIPALRQRFRTISIDLRGHGQSAKPVRREDYSLEAMSDDVFALMRHLGIEECYLAGHSMGGMIAQHLVLSQPEPFRALVLVDTAAEVPQGMASAERRKERERLVQIAREQGMEVVFEEQLKASPMADQLRAMPQVLEGYRQQFLMTSREAYLYCADAMARREPLIGQLANVRIPTLIIVGENDEPFVAPSKRMNEAIPGSELVVIEGSGHTPQVERAAEFNRVLTGFLEKVQAGATAV